LTPGTPLVFTYLVTNTGNTTIDPVTVTDTVLGPITCPSLVLEPAATETCTADGGPAAAGQLSNTATATGQGVDGTGAPLGAPVTDTASANYIGAVPGISVEKQINGQVEPDPPGPYLSVGTPVTYTYIVSNLGNVPLNSVTLNDSALGPITCPDTSLPVGGQEGCTAAGGDATAGQQSDVAVAMGQPAPGTSVSADAVANYFGAFTGLNLVKQVNGQEQPTAPGLYVAAGDPITFTYLVTNTGNVRLDPVQVNDDVLGAITCPQTILDPGDTETCIADGGAAVAGQHGNTGTATGEGVDSATNPVPGLPTATGSETADYFGYLQNMTLVEDIDGHHDPTPPGLDVNDGQTLTFTDTLTDTGNLPLEQITVSDDVLGTISCPASTLAPGASMTCTGTSTAMAGDQEHTATADGQSLDALNDPIGPPETAADVAFYDGLSTPPPTSTTTVATGTTTTTTASTSTTSPSGATTTTSTTTPSAATTTVAVAVAAQPSSSSGSLSFTGTNAIRLTEIALILLMAGLLVLRATSWRRERRRS
jgi:hypothetical protein